MEDNFYLDDFELSLKEQANQFKMTPSKKVWHGIYNDMHPGRRWPSITVSLLLVISIVFVGYINTHNDKTLINSQLQTLAENENAQKAQTRAANERIIISEKTPDSKNIGNSRLAAQTKDLTSVSGSYANGSYDIRPAESSISTDISHQKKSGVSTAASTALSEIAQNKHLPDELTSVNFSSKDQTSNFSQANDIYGAGKIQRKERIENDGVDVDRYVESLFERSNVKNSSSLFSSSVSIFPAGSIFLNNSSLVILASANVVNAEDPSVADTPAADKKLIVKARRKKNSKMSLQFYGAAFVSSASFNGDHLTKNPNQNSLSLPQVTQKDMRIIYNPALGYEAGIQMNYLFAKKLQFNAGVQFNRSGYNITSSEVHPTVTTLLLKHKATGDQYSRNFVTHYGDGNGQSTKTLHNYSYQASLPVGVQYQLVGNDKVQFNLGINIQPSLTLKSNAYLLSSDGRNYVNVPDLYRKWNLNSSFTPFVTFKSDKFRWNIGPVVRYQWLSSYMDDYTIKEHLFNYGIRLGISK